MSSRATAALGGLAAAMLVILVVVLLEVFALQGEINRLHDEIQAIPGQFEHLGEQSPAPEESVSPVPS